MARKSKAKSSPKSARKSPTRRASKTTRAGAAKRAHRKSSKVSTSSGAPNADAALMSAPPSGVKVRMYRQGHGDCFLLAFASPSGPVYVLIDCGFKPGSSVHADIGAIVDHIRASTGGRIDLAIVTHEHQDHVNGIWKKGTPYFDKFKIGEAWFAWTEDGSDKLANELRKRHHDQLLGLVAARNQLAAAGASTGILDSLLSLEFGIDDPAMFAAAGKDPNASINKQGMKLIKGKAGKKNTKYILPHKEIMSIPGIDGVRVFAFGPPYSAELIGDEDPQGTEAFPGHALSACSSFFAAAKSDVQGKLDIQPFASRFSVTLDRAFNDPDYGNFFRSHYGNTKQ